MVRIFAVMIAVGAMTLITNAAMAQHRHGGGHYHGGGFNRGISNTVISVGFGNGGGFSYGRGVPSYGGFGYSRPVYGYARPVYAPVHVHRPYYGGGFGGSYYGGYGRPGCGGGYYRGW